MRKLRFAALDQDVRELVRRSAAIESAPSGAKARVLARVEAIVGAGGLGGEQGVRATQGFPSSQPHPSRLWRVVTLATTFALGGALGAYVMQRSGTASAPVTAPPEPRASSAPPTAASIEPSTTNPEVAASTPLPSTEPFKVSKTSRSVQAVAPSSASPRNENPSGAASDRAANERALLDLARGAIEREDGATALAATEEHEREFPRGVLVQEREAIAVRALTLLGRAAEARARLDRFRKNFPDSLLLPALESNVNSLAP
jgi:hypothetical protein